MGVAFDTFNQYAGKAYEGQVHDLSMADLTSGVALTDIPFARALFAGAAKDSVQLAGTNAGLFMGFSIRQVVGVSSSYLTGSNSVNGNVIGSYRENEEVTILSTGRLFVKTIGGATKGGQVYAIPNTGEVTNAATAGNQLLPGCLFLDNAIAGEIVEIQVRASANTTLTA